MTTDYKALCAELLVLAEESTSYRVQNCEAVQLIDRARAALAAEPVPPNDGEVAKLVVWLWSMHELAGECNPDEQCRYARAQRLVEPACVVLRPSPELIKAFEAAGAGRIEAMERLAPQPMPEVPSDAELLELMPQQFQADLATVSRLAAHGTGRDVTPGLFRVSLNTGALDYARAVLARWGR